MSGSVMDAADRLSAPEAADAKASAGAAATNTSGAEAGARVIRQLVIVEWKGRLLTAVYENDKLAELLLDDQEDRILGNIYVGKVQNIVKNINAAFVEFDHQKRRCGYYSLSENKSHFFMNQKKSAALVPGDELLVQVIKEPVKTKTATLTGKFTITGQRLVLTAKKCLVGISSKITDEAEKGRLRSLIEPLVTENYGFIIRTQAEGCDAMELCEEAAGLARRYEELLRKASFSKCFTKLYSELPSYLKYAQSHPDIDKITTDLPDVYQQLEAGIQNLGLSIPIVFYEDESWPLIKLKSLPTHIERALNPLVWLKSGGFLTIQPTEAMVVIDVNTGRYMGKKTDQETFFKTNMEAAHEIARQLRLRNLSGIIIIDFIDMKDASMRKRLFSELGELVAKDTVKTTLVDTTRLGLVEMTRKKERRPLHEQLLKACPKCHGHGMIEVENYET